MKENTMIGTNSSRSVVKAWSVAVILMMWLAGGLWCRAAEPGAKGGALSAAKQAGKAVTNDEPDVEVVVSNKAVKVEVPRLAGLRIENVTVTPRDAKTAVVTFDVSWSYSWRWGVFHDAAWVFFKVRAADAAAGLGAGQAEWQPVRLAADKVYGPSGYGQEKGGTPLEFLVPDGEDGFTGLFVRRSGDGHGGVAARKVTAVWDLSALRGIGDISKAQVRGFGVELVYVPEGPFFVGLGAEEPIPSAGYGFGGQEQNWLYQYSRSDGKDFVASFLYSRAGYVNAWVIGAPEEKIPAYQVSGPGPIPTGRQKGSLWASDIKPEDKGEIPATFPNGYAAFYCMKYSWITQGQYADFLNSLTVEQAKPRYWIEGHGMAISGGGTAVKRLGKAPDYTYAATDPDGMCPWVCWKDAVLYTAWAGLRPMTELEFEKMLRGPEFAAPNDASPSYWGANGVQVLRLFERAVSIGDAVGRAFKGSHGRGTLELPADWPVTHFEGVILRGDAVPSVWTPGTFVPTHLLIAGRTSPLYADADQCNDPYPGWRGVRSAPVPAGTALTGKVGGDSGMAPFKRPEPQTYKLVRMKQAMKPDGALDEWEKPTLTLADPVQIQPSHMRFPSCDNTNAWRGSSDMSVKAWLGWDGEAVCVAVEVKDDVACNTNSVESLWDGDSMNFGLVDVDGNQTDLWLALTANGAVLNPLADPTEKLEKLAKYAVVRDEAGQVTRYELRIPLAGLLLKPGVECCFYFRFFDNDGTGARYRFQLAPVITDPFRAKSYSKFVLGE